MKVKFIQPCFVGSRFDEHTLPLEVAKDLVAYESLVVELAKELYLKEHVGRQRVPKGFDSDFHLHIEKIEEGSSKPLLSVVTSGLLALGAQGNTYFDQARDLINECIAAPIEQLPSSFPRHLLVYFNQIGQSLKPDEQLELPTSSGGEPARLTPDRRKRLVLAADKVYEREIELVGIIEESDFGKSTFRLRMTDGSQATIPMPDSFRDRSRDCLGKDRVQVIVKGVGTYDSWDKLQKVISIHSLSVQNNYQLASAFDRLTDLTDGWLDGAGFAPDKDKLEDVAEQFIQNYPEQASLPAIIPTPEGNLLLEWDREGTPSLDINLSELSGYFHCMSAQGDVERDFSLTDKKAWQDFFDFLATTVGVLS